MHRTRQASNLIIPKPQIDSHIENAEERNEKKECFECPVMFEDNFELNHRCNMRQTILALESSVLHPFAVSNRGSFFVYKDETDNIFYMKLTSNSDDRITLLIYGIERPDESITIQLPRLLRNKMVSLSIDVVSSVLQKNPCYSLLPNDVQFLRTFQQENEYAGAESLSHFPAVCEYEFPEYAYDPVLILMYFHRNIISSTYFHHLHESLSQNEVDSESNFVPPITNNNFDSGLLMKYDYRSFRIYFNNAPSAIKSTSTLTDKGLQLLRKTGTGIALIDLILFRGDGSPVENIYTGKSVSLANWSLENIFVPFRKLDPGKSAGALYPFRLQVKIANTTLDSKVLHEWIYLTLNQALLGWFIERSSEKIKKNMQILRGNMDVEKSQDKCLSDVKYLSTVLFRLQENCLRGFKLPSPTIYRFYQKHIIPIATVPKIVLDLFEQVVLVSLYGDKRLNHHNHKNLIVLRLHKGSDPRIVSLRRNEGENGNSNLVSIRDLFSDSDEEFFDLPGESPEYICFYYDSLRKVQKDSEITSNQKQMLKASMLLFSEVNVGDGGIENNSYQYMTNALKFLKSKNPQIFQRSLSCIISVGRTYQSMFIYNWHPRIAQEASRRFHEIFEDVKQMEKKRIVRSQNNCLGRLSLAYSNGANEIKVKSDNLSRQIKNLDTIQSSQQKDINRTRNEKFHGNTDQPNLSATTATRSSLRKKNTPKTIRRPKLVGRSVDGAAMQAVLASRARASSRPMMSGSKSIDQRKSRGGRDKNNSMGSIRESTPQATRKESTVHHQKKDEDDESLLSNSKIRSSDDHSEASSVLSRPNISKRVLVREIQVHTSISSNLSSMYPCLHGYWNVVTHTTRRFSLNNRNFFAQHLISPKYTETFPVSAFRLFKSFSSTMKSCSCPIPSYFIATDLLPSIFLRDLSKFLINFLSFGSPEINMKVINISNEASDGHMMRKNCLCTRAILKRKCGFCIIILELSLENRIHAQGAIVSCRIWQSIQSNKNSLAKVSMAKMEKKSDLLKDLLNTFQVRNSNTM